MSKSSAKSGPPRQRARLPGDPSAEQLIDRIIRVDHAGEFGAKRIYQGQLAVLRGSPSEAPIRHMAEQEERHLQAFERMMAEHRVRPTALSPLWSAAGFALGAASALLGEKAAMACTEAVEEVIDEHYARQIEQLGQSEPALKGAIESFRADEIEHRDLARELGAREAPLYELVGLATRTASRLAIWLSERI
jgi:ubiquinone biosynthesis monooxygenase Coq7